MLTKILKNWLQDLYLEHLMPPWKSLKIILDLLFSESGWVLFRIVEDQKGNLWEVEMLLAAFEVIIQTCHFAFVLYFLLIFVEWIRFGPIWDCRRSKGEFIRDGKIVKLFTSPSAFQQHRSCYQKLQIIQIQKIISNAKHWATISDHFPVSNDW